MAQYRFSAQVIGRSSGRSSVAAAAYRAGVSMADERTGQLHDFSRRGGVLHSEIMAPDNAPDWMRDRARLWNAVEKIETRTNSQLAREIQLSLPHELTNAQRLELVRGFARDQFVSRGMIADIAIHAPGKDGDERNHHAHIMLTMRELRGEGFHSSKATPTARAWNAKENVEQWREAWGEIQNRTFQKAGLALAVDHRSLAAQGIDREPTSHLGPCANDMERRGKPSRIVAENRRIDMRNKARTDNDRERVVVSLERERLRHEEARVQHERRAALESAQALTALDLDQRQHSQILKLEGALDDHYGAERRNLESAAVSITSRLETTGFRKIVRDLAGRTERDRLQLDGIQRTLADIRAREADERRRLAKQHQAERDALKAAQAKQIEQTAARVAAEFKGKARSAMAGVWARIKQRRQIDRAAPGNEPVKSDFDKVAEANRAYARVAETERKFLRVPAPQPTPRGDVIVPRRELAEVPKPMPARTQAAEAPAPSKAGAAPEPSLDMLQKKVEQAEKTLAAMRATLAKMEEMERADSQQKAAQEPERSAPPATVKAPVQQEAKQAQRPPIEAAAREKPPAAERFNEAAKERAAEAFPTSRPAFEQAAAPSPTPPEPERPKTRADYWAERAKQQEKQEQSREQTRDYDRDR